jgi:hypothetical protein
VKERRRDHGSDKYKDNEGQQVMAGDSYKPIGYLPSCGLDEKL